MDKDVVVHIHNGKLHSYKNAFESVLMRWMNLESIMQSEVCQKEKDKYRVLMHVCGTQKVGTDESVCKAAVETQT